MAFTKSDECWVFALYGIDATGESLGSIYEELLAWLDAHDAPPDKLSVHGEGFPGKVGAFPRLHAKLEKAGFEKVESLSLFSLLPDADLPVRDWKAEADLSPRHSCAVFAADASLAGVESMLDITRRAVEHLRPVYGIGYRRERRLGPVLYAYGMSYGINAFSGPEYEESLRISRWGDTAMEGGMYRQGLLRDVYPYNLLTEVHLAARVEGVRLEEWIREGAGRGELAPFQGGVRLWKVDDAARERVRPALRQAGLIFDAEQASGGSSD